jgi:hypothetical protein
MSMKLPAITAFAHRLTRIPDRKLSAGARVWQPTSSLREPLSRSTPRERRARSRPTRPVPTCPMGRATPERSRDTRREAGFCFRGMQLPPTGVCDYCG